MDWKSLGNPIAPDPHTFGYRWDQKWVRPAGSGQGSLVALPDCYHLVTDGKNKPEWKPVAAAEVPEETGLAKWTYHPPSQKPLPPYTTPEDASSCWKKPGPVAGPFQARLGDGSVVTYFWYRFADQPALLNADLSEAEREAMQARAVKLHRAWTKDRDYLPPPAAGALAEIDPALVVTPPKGFEAGYVPIVTRQEAGTRRNDEL